MAAPRKWSDETRAAIHELVNEQQRPATDIGPILEQRGLPIPPLETIRTIARQERHDITDRPKAQQLRELTGLAVRVIHDGFARQQAKNADADPDDTLKLVRSLRELEPMLTDRPAEKDTQPSGLLGNLSQDTQTPSAQPTNGKVVAVRSLRS